MATSRLEKIGTIYSRITGLLRSNALKSSNKPIWYDIYQNFPPKYTPKFDRPIPNIEVPEIFYPEDKVRAKFNQQKSISRSSVNLLDTVRLSDSQKCIAFYEELQCEIENEDEAFAKAVEKVVANLPVRKESPSTISIGSIANEFKISKGINVEELFKK